MCSPQTWPDKTCGAGPVLSRPSPRASSTRPIRRCLPELDPDRDRFIGRSRRLQRRAAGFLGYNVHLGSRLPVRGALLMTAFGWLALVPLVLRVVFPWLSSRWTRVRETSVAASRTRLQLDRTDETPPLGRYVGFTVR